MNYEQASEHYDYGNVYSVYALVFPDGKLYIGSTRQEPKKRWRSGQGYRNTKTIYSAIQECGWENIKPVVLVDKLSFDVAMIMEMELIKKYDSQNPDRGYNTKPGGQFYGEHSEEFLEKMHNRMVGNTYCVGRKLRPEHIEALRRANLGSHHPSPFKGKHIHSEERKKKMSEIAKARWESPEYREKCKRSRPDTHGKNNPMYGKKHSEETRRKISEAHKGKHLSEEHKAKLMDRNSRGVYKLDLDGNIICKYKSLARASEDVGAKSTNIGFCCRNKNRTAKGFMWRYADEIDRGFPESNGKA